VLETEAFSLAARLYVVMRQKLGRITDVQWMLKNPEYAVEIIRLAREQGGSELPVLADKFEAILVSQRSGGQVGRRPVSDLQTSGGPGPASPGHSLAKPKSEPASEEAEPRYVGRLR
jgi:hypothetical protein